VWHRNESLLGAVDTDLCERKIAMTLRKTHDAEPLQEYAVDIGPLKDVHLAIVAKRTEIEELIAQEEQLGIVGGMSDEAKERLKSRVDQLLEEWERDRDTEISKTGSVAFQKLAREHFDLEQKILNAEDQQAEEVAERPFEHPLR
jgi:hypothetical protein